MAPFCNLWKKLACNNVWYSEEGPGGCGPTQAPPHCTKYNGPPINGQCTDFILFDVALQLPLHSKRLNAVSKLNNILIIATDYTYRARSK